MTSEDDTYISYILVAQPVQKQAVVILIALVNVPIMSTLPTLPQKLCQTPSESSTSTGEECCYTGKELGD